jgi:translation initiation factor IF-1
MTIDISKIKPGDYVTVRAKVTAIQEEPVEFCIAPKVIRGSTMWVSPSAIVGHEPAPEQLKVGDVVEVYPGKSQGTIVGLHDGNAWVYVFKQAYLWKKLSELRRVDQP